MQTYGDPSQRQVMVRVPQVGAEAGRSAEHDARRRSKPRSARANLGNFTVVGTRDRRPGGRRRADAEGASGRSCSRSSASWRTSPSASSSRSPSARSSPPLHDVLVTLAFLAFFHYDLSLNVVAAILTVTGYSTNDTIVIFDRVRENMRKMRRDSLDEVINIVDQPDAGPHGHHRRHGAAVGDRAVPVRRRGAARLCVHDDRRHRHRHVLERVRRRRHRDVLASEAAVEGRRGGAAARPRADAGAPVEVAAQGASVIGRAADGDPTLVA